jgi:Domain of unknown function (DUF4340)
MDRRLTLVLLLVLAAVGGAAWWLERPGQAPAATATPSSAPLWTLESTDVVKVTLEDTHAHSVIELDRQADGTWSIVRPSQQAADTGAVELAVGQIAKMSIITDLGTELRIENFGVDKPAFRITLTTADTAYTLEVGSATVTGSGYYVRKQGDARVVVVGTDASALRDRRADRDALTDRNGHRAGHAGAGNRNCRRDSIGSLPPRRHEGLVPRLGIRLLAFRAYDSKPNRL